MNRTRMLFARGALLPGVAGSRIIGVLCAAADGTITAANETFLAMANRSADAVEAGAVSWREVFGDAVPAAEPFHADLNRGDGRTRAVLVETTLEDDGGCTAFVVDMTATRVAELALTRAREVLEERSTQLFGARDHATTMAERLTASEDALASAHRSIDSSAADLETERRRVEELAADLANANRELDAFSYSVSHDLRTPLRSIDGFSRILLSHYGPRFDARGRDYLERVRNAAQRMSTLLDDLLTLARTSRAALNPSTVDLSATAAQIAAELQQSNPQRRVAWTIEPGLTARGDRTLLRVVLENLLGNAWKFTSKKDECRIELGREGNAFVVRDDGAGFEMRYADQLFGVFQRLHTAAEFEGTGIGLATVQRIVHRHGGEVWAEGAVGRGATFRFTIGEKRRSP